MSAHENARPGTRLDREGLVEPEGVNAGSAASAAESAADRPSGDPTRGGRPEAADEQAESAPERDQVVDAPWGRGRPGGASLPQSEEEQGIRRR